MTGDGVKTGAVLVLSAAASAGHVRSAEALEAAFAAKGIAAKHVERMRQAVRRLARPNARPTSCPGSPGRYFRQRNSPRFRDTIAFDGLKGIQME